MSEHPGDGGPPPPETAVTGGHPRPERADAAHDAPTTSHFGDGVPEGEAPAGDTATSRPAPPADPYTSPSSGGDTAGAGHEGGAPSGHGTGHEDGSDNDADDVADDAVRRTVGAGTQDPPSGEGQFSAVSAGYDVAPEGTDEPATDDDQEGRR